MRWVVDELGSPPVHKCMSVYWRQRTTGNRERMPLVQPHLPPFLDDTVWGGAGRNFLSRERRAMCLVECRVRRPRSRSEKPSHSLRVATLPLGTRRAGRSAVVANETYLPPRHGDPFDFWSRRLGRGVAAGALWCTAPPPAGGFWTAPKLVLIMIKQFARKPELHAPALPRFLTSSAADAGEWFAFGRGVCGVGGGCRKEEEVGGRERGQGVLQPNFPSRRTQCRILQRSGDETERGRTRRSERRVFRGEEICERAALLASWRNEQGGVHHAGASWNERRGGGTRL
ncbi:hypothetical protein K438DRAFT_260083 [Mycena galopus ATCC 62051]|nr:hypothetical protein K438DRAFT_260083 [Mycena galopus ATCC 62051]